MNFDHWNRKGDASAQLARRALGQTRLCGSLDLPKRNAFMLLEILVAMAFFAVVVAFAMKMQLLTQDYDRVCRDRLRQQLAAENLAEEISVMPYDELVDSTTEFSLADGVDITAVPFECELGNGLHIMIQFASEGGPVRHHLWRLSPQS